MNLLPILVGSICVLAAVAVVGHGIWVIAASILSGASESPATGRGESLSSQSPAAREPKVPRCCPRCGLPIGSERCLACDWPTSEASATKRPQAALATLEKQLENLSRLGILDPSAQQSFSRLISDERQRLSDAARASAAAEETWQAAEKRELAAADPLGEAVAPTPAPGGPIAAQALPPPPLDRELASQVSVAARAATFKAAQERMPQAAASPPAEPRRTWIDLLAAFMEERNMRWGEMVGGLLIVCCSIALVVSFWSEIAERPWLKFFLFGGVTAGLFGVGFYSEHRWRLHTTSQGLLLIANLLVPLNFLAIAAFSATASADTPLAVGGEAISVALFAVLAYWAGKILVERDAEWLVAGILVPSVAQLLVRRYVDPASGLQLLTALAAVPLACYLVVNGWTLWRTSDVLVLSEQEVNSSFKFFGLTTFAALLPLGLLLFKTEQPMETLRQLPPLLCIGGLVPLGVGLTLWQKLAGRGLTGLRTAGTSLAVFGAIVSLAGLALGWPEPRTMLPAALIEFAIFTFVAWRFAMPAAHLVAAACLAIGYLLGVYLADHAIAWRTQDPHALAQVLVSGETGTLLAPLVVAYAGAAYLLLRSKHRGGRALATACGALAVVSVALVSWFGFGVEGDPAGAAWVYLLYAAGCLPLAARSHRAAIGTLAAALLLAAVVQEVMFRYGAMLGPAQPEITALLVYCTLGMLIVGILRLPRVASHDSPLGDILCSGSLVCSLVASGWLALLVPSHGAAFEGGYWLWLSFAWLAMALATTWLPVWTLFQISLSAATVFAVVAQLENRAWFAESREPWLDPWTLEAVLVALAAVNLAWTVLRMVCRHASRGNAPESFVARASRLLASPWLALDRATSGVLVALLAAIAVYAAVPGTLQELSPRVAPAPAVAAVMATPTVERVVPPIENFQWRGIPHEHAAGWGSWALLGAVLVLLAAIVREQRWPAWLLCMFVAAAASCPLIASRWESEVAVASALRWLSAGLLLAGSAPIWGRQWVARQAERLGWRLEATDWSLPSTARALIFFLGLWPPVAMGLAIALGALARSAGAGSFWSDSRMLWIVLGASILIAAALHEIPERWVQGDTTASRPTWPRTTSALVLVLGTAPILSIILYHVGIALRQSPILGPDPDSIFARMGLAGSYAGPILITAVVLAGYALRERSSAFALAGGLVINAGATAAYLLAISKGGVTFDAVVWIQLAQLNAAVAACYALAWLATLALGKSRSGRRESIATDFLLNTQLALAPALVALALGWAWCQLVWAPQGNLQQPRQALMNLELADVWGWTSFALACASVGASVWLAGRRLTMFGTSAILVAVAIFAAVIASRWDVGDWRAYNTLLVGHGVIATALVALAWCDKRGWLEWPSAGAAAGEAGEPWIVLQAAIVAALSVRELSDNNLWPAGGLAFLGVLLAPGLAWLFQRRRYLYIAGAMINGSGLLIANELGIISGFDDFIYFNVILLALPVTAWLLVELGGIRTRQFAPLLQAPPFHRVATRIALAVLAIAVGVGLYSDAMGHPIAPPNGALDWIALAVTAIAALACSWDATAKDSVAGLYFLGLVAGAMLVDAFNLAPPMLLWTGTMVTAAYAVATSYLWSRRRGLLAIMDRLRVPRHSHHEFAGLDWLVPCNLLLVAAVVMMTLAVELTSRDVSLRVLAAQATLAQVVSVALLARGDRRGVLQNSALQLGAMAAVMFAWAWLTVGTTLTLLHCLVAAAAALAVVAVLYGLGLAKLLRDSSDWLAPARRLTPALAALSAAAILTTLGVEIFQFSETGEVEIAAGAIIVVAVTLAGLFAAALAAAILPGRDPLALSARGRTLYVYAAEILLGLLFVHIRLTMPWLFTGFFQQYWPLVVMAIAFLGVGFAELCRRRKQEVLAEPIENTGALLPVLPVLGFWAADTEVHYSLLLLTVGVLYAGLSIARRSFAFGLLAALAANGGLWYFLNRQEGFGVLDHPQIWLIPPALCVLAAAYLNRRQMAESQMTAIRYLASMTIYLSSTSDIFLNGVAQAPNLPLVLAVLSVAGILAGMLLRVRAFLFLGTGFLGLALFTIIYHAAVDLEQTWIWWVCGIVLGLAIFALFAVFEKKRQDVLEMFEKIKQWEG